MTVKKIMRREPVAALVVGGLVGAGVALMAAPMSGREVRRRIGMLAGGANDKVRDYAEAGMAKVTHIAERGRNYVMGRKTLVTNTVAAGMQAYRKEREKLH